MTTITAREFLCTDDSKILNQQTLAAAIVSPEYARIIFEHAAPKDFEAMYWNIAEIIKGLVDSGQEPDYHTVISRCNGDAQLFDAIALYLQDPSFNPTHVWVKQWAKLLATNKRKRALSNLLMNSATSILISEDCDTDRIKIAQALIQAGGNSKSKFSDPIDLTGRVSEKIAQWLANPATCWGLSTGFVALDRALGGLEDESLYILGARPSMGKTALGLAMADNIASAGNAVAFFSLEMSDEQLQLRRVCMRGGFDSYEIKRGQKKTATGWRAWSEHERRNIFELTERLRDSPLFINPQSSVTTAQARAAMTELCINQNIRALFFDYINLSGEEGVNDNQIMSKASAGLKAIGKDLHIPVVALAQLNRGVEARQEKRPSLADLRDSGTIEQNADAVLFIYRDDYYKKNAENYLRTGIAEVNIEKNRNGKIGQALLHFEENYTKFTDVANEN
jgi:replicative DNA helicase